MDIAIVAWDFDGVLNRNLVDGRFVWARDFEADLRQSLSVFVAEIFAKDFDDVITGREDLRDRVAAWARKVGYDHGPDALLAYWFRKDALPDPAMLALMDRLQARGVRQVITTNNEHRRAVYIEQEMGFGTRVERLFASGRMGLKKPQAAYFTHVTEALGVRPEAMLLIDDVAANVDQAMRSGWQAVHYTEALGPDLEAFLPL